MKKWRNNYIDHSERKLTTVRKKIKESTLKEKKTCINIIE